MTDDGVTCCTRSLKHPVKDHLLPIPNEGTNLSSYPRVPVGVGTLWPIESTVQRPDWAAEMLEGEAGEVRAGDAGAFDQNHARGDWLESGAEVSLAFQSDQGERSWLDANRAEDIEIDRCFGA